MKFESFSKFKIVRGWSVVTGGLSVDSCQILCLLELFDWAQDVTQN